MEHRLHELISRFSSAHIHIHQITRQTILPSGCANLELAEHPAFLFSLCGNTHLTEHRRIDAAKVVHFEPSDGESHPWLCSADDKLPSELVYISYEPDSADGEHKFFPEGFSSLEIGESIKLRSLLEELVKEWNEQSLLSPLRCRALLLRILDEVFTCAIRMEDSSEQAKFLKIRDYIHANYREKLSVTSLCETFHIKPNPLYYLFSKNIQMGPMEYLIAYRMHRAEILLKTSDLSVKEISFSVGYDDPQYFSRQFKKKFGRSPTEVRNAYRLCP